MFAMQWENYNGQLDQFAQYNFVLRSTNPHNREQITEREMVPTPNYPSRYPPSQLPIQIDYSTYGYQQQRFPPTASMFEEALTTPVDWHSTGTQFQTPRQMPSEIYGGSSFLQHGLKQESLEISASSSEEGSSLTTEEMAKTKLGEPYAKLIQKALLSTDDNKMALQQIYQWFRENTDRANGDGKGWQNSIRHNLSMNKAFLKCERDGAGERDAKKSTVWQLAPFAVHGDVQSTTRYRKGNPPRRSSHTERSRRPTPSRRGRTNTKNKSVDVRRSQTKTSDSLHNHIDPAIGSANNQLFSYNYPYIPEPIMEEVNWIGQPSQSLPSTPEFEFNAYTYENPPHNEVLGDYSQGNPTQALYQPPVVPSNYEESPLTSHLQTHNNFNFAMPPSYDNLMPNPQESVERNYLNWNATSGTDSYA